LQRAYAKILFICFLRFAYSNICGLIESMTFLVAVVQNKKTVAWKVITAESRGPELLDRPNLAP
jgi:hypothetical protein